MITVEELHIAFREGLNQIASYQGEEFLDDEIDRYLTRSQISIITSLFPYYSQKQQAYLELATLEVSNYKTNVYYPQDTEPIYYVHPDYEFGYIIPPTNYMYAINVKPYIKGAKICDINYTNVNTNVIEYVAIVPYTFGEDLIIKNNSSVILSLSGYNLPTITDENDKFYYLQVVLQEFNQRNTVNISGNTITNNPANNYLLNNINVYWEKYREFYYPNSFIFVSNEVQSGYMEVVTNNALSTAYSITNTDTTHYIIENERARGFWYSKTYVTRSGTGVSYDQTTIAREVDKKKAYELLENPLEKPTRDRPHTVHTDNYLWIHTPKKSVASMCYLDYIRYPRPVSRRLQWHSEFNRTMMQDIVNRAVGFAMSEIGDNKIQTKLQIDKLDG